MAYYKVAQGDSFYNSHSQLTKGASQFLCEEVADVAKLPGADTLTPGSRAVVIPTGEVYVLGPTKGWIKSSVIATI